MIMIIIIIITKLLFSTVSFTNPGIENALFVK